jgi:pyruvate dehydrogenase phosphatase
VEREQPFTAQELKELGVKKDAIPAKLLSPSQVSAKLRAHERDVQVGRGVIQSYSKASVASNDPIEDRQGEALGQAASVFGVFDGHAGFQVSEYLHRVVPAAILERAETEAVDRGGEVARQVFESEDDAVVRGVLRLARQGKEVTGDLVRRMYAGSCAIVALVKQDSLFVVNTGDCRAVLGVKSPDGYRALPLSTDHTFDNPSEVARTFAEHPNEEVIRKKRVFGGLQPSRAFGDSIYKLAPSEVDEMETQLMTHLGDLYQRKARRIPRELLKTTPYVTAQPEITQHHLKKGDSFLVLATDGLWDSLSSQEAVDIVAAHLATQKHSHGDSDFIPIHQRGKQTRVVVDDNVATHLIRNSIGGDTPTTSLLLSIPAPHSRYSRDDISVTVVFFDQDKLQE